MSVNNLSAGDLVVAIKDGSRGPEGPEFVPIKGKIYRLLSLYPICYGVGCRLEGLSPFPYQGFMFYVNPDCAASCFGHPVESGFYFEKVERVEEKAEGYFIDMLKNLGTVKKDA